MVPRLVCGASKRVIKLVQKRIMFEVITTNLIPFFPLSPSPLSSISSSDRRSSAANPLKHSKMYPNPSLGTILIPISTASLGIILPFSGTNYGRHGDEELFRAQPRPLIIPLIDAPTRALPPPYLLPILLIFPYPFFPPAFLLPAYFLPFLLSFSSLYAPLPLSVSSFQFSPHFPFFSFLKSCSIFPFLLRSPYCVPPPTFCHLPPSFFLLTTSRPPFQLLLRPLFYLLADLRENSVCPL